MICPENYVLIQSRILFNGDIINQFCVSKYEMKCDLDSGDCGNPGTKIPQSIPENKPWHSISQLNAINRCKAIGPGYDLISDKQWMAIAEDIISVPINNFVLDGDPRFARGHSDDNPSYSLDANSVDPNLNNCNLLSPLGHPNNANCELKNELGYFKTENSWEEGHGLGAEQLRIHVLSSGEIIWDLAGNVFSHTKEILPLHTSYSWPPRAYNTAINYNNIEWMEPSIKYSLLSGIGGFYVVGSSDRTNQRGGHWAREEYAGIFHTTVCNSCTTAFSSDGNGYRCVYMK